MSGRHRTSGTGDEAITDGIDIKSWSVKHSTGATVTFSTWDFAGQNVYYNTHQVRVHADCNEIQSETAAIKHNALGRQQV